MNHPRTATATFPAFPVQTRPIPVSPARRATPAAEQRPPVDITRNVVAERQVPGFRVEEIQYPAGLEISRQSHEQALLTFVLEGELIESYADGSQITCRGRTLRYLPMGYRYSAVSESGARCLVVSVDREALSRVDKHSKALERPAAIQTPATLWLTHKLHREFQQRDASSAISLEGILLELLAETARHAGSGPVRIVPEWLRVARAYVETNYLRPLSLADIARVAHVHRVHLARQFRSYFSTSVGELLRRKRVEHACHLVSTTNCSLAEVAIDCGFSDQSHFSATFRKLMGLTPARFREMAQAPNHPAPQEAKLAYAGKS
jgi:AraC family transcriptional regulator